MAKINKIVACVQRTPHKVSRRVGRPHPCVYTGELARALTYQDICSNIYSETAAAAPLTPPK